VAYRGRVLLELQSVLSERPSKVVDDILHEDVLRVQVTYLRICLSIGLPTVRFTMLDSP